ncbi:MAG: DUF262 domain-containing protein [Mangrovibacterium sp.]
MKATQAQLLSLLDGKKQFTIPIYQRTYSWKIPQCQQLFDDILRIGNDITELSHFIGSIVYFKSDNSPITSMPELLVIDGQQRLTTVSLMLLALIHYLKEHVDVSLEDKTWEEIQETYLVNKDKEDDSKFKLLLTRKDKTTFTKLIDEIDIDGEYSERVLENYQFFKDKFCDENVQAIYHGIKKLIIVDVILERDKDNPQLIFESLNSTGLDLSQADLIRNYILMGQPLELQNVLYEKYWYPMEQSFGEKIGALARFIRDYLTMKESSIPKIDLVYEAYKRFLNSKDGFKSIEDAIKSLHRYSKFYVRIALLKEQDTDIAKKLKEIAKLKIDTSYPFLLAVYGDFEKEQINKDEFIEIISLVSNYVLRRAICGIPTNSLNKTFAALYKQIKRETYYKQIKRETYLESVKAAFLLMDGCRRFPLDDEFTKELQVKDVYNFRSRNYLLESLENWERKELVNAENYTIEHILPQNSNVSPQWQQELGENWKGIKDKYLHSLGNLSLTGYNSELSDRPFADKKSIKGGFNTSPLFLNASVREATTWNEDAILKRASKLAERACKVWQKPNLSNDKLELYKEPETTKEQAVYNIEHLQGDKLYKNLKKRVLNLDASVRVEFKKSYIAFEAQTNFVNVVPLKTRLHLYIKDPKGICKDVSGLIEWGNGDVEVVLKKLNDLDYIMELIEQVFEGQVESV